MHYTIKGFGILFFVSALAWQVQGQIPSGTWRDHLPYGHGKKLAEYDNRIFCATADGSLYSYSIKDRTIKKHSKVNGLSDADISTIGVSPATNTFFVGYSNGNIDLIKNDSIINIPDVKRKMIMGIKAINNVYFRNQYAYLACGFGIVLCDLSRREIKDTYLFGPNGSQISVNDITSDDTFLYAATDQGIYKAAIDDPNLLDFNAWEHLTALPDADAAYHYVVSYNNRLLTIHKDPVSSLDNVIAFSDLSWEYWENNQPDHYEYMGEQHGYLKLSSEDRIKIYGPEENLERDLVSYIGRYVLLDSKNTVWYAAAYGGLVKIDDQGNGTAFVPDGPAYREVGDIEVFNGKVWVGGGNFESRWTGYGAYSFIDEQWANYNANNIPALKDFLNISEISIDPTDPGHIIGGSYGYGIAEFQDGQLTGIEDETGGILKPAKGFENQPGYVLITGTDIDKDGNIFAAASESETGVYKKEKGKSWEAIEMSHKFKYNVKVGEILATTGKQLWVLLTDSMLVFTEENGIAINERSFVVKNQEETVLDRIFSIAEDKEGNIWIGTNKGPVVYYNPTAIFETPKIVGDQPLIPRNDGTEFASLLLSSEQINDIEVDGANRKWLATEKSGAFLVSPNGKKEIYHFTEENSPLLSNSVRTIGVNDKTGEVFFGTEKGIVAFRAGATEGGDDFGDVYVFPDPVREDYSGDITVTGLARDVNVKFTDISGNLVFETTALGGQAIWNGKNFRGERVHTGVYLVFCTNEDGSKTFVTKLLFIH